MGIIARVARVFLERDWVRYLLRRGVDLDLDAENPQARHHLIEEVRDAAGIQRNKLDRSFKGADSEIVVDKVELDLKGATAERERPRGQTAVGEMQSGVPELVLKRSELDIELADDLGPHVQRFPRVGPGFKGQGGPTLFIRERGLHGTIRDRHSAPQGSRPLASTSEGPRWPAARGILSTCATGFDE